MQGMTQYSQLFWNAVQSVWPWPEVGFNQPIAQVKREFTANSSYCTVLPEEGKLPDFVAHLQDMLRQPLGETFEVAATSEDHPDHYDYDVEMELREISSVPSENTSASQKHKLVVTIRRHAKVREMATA